MSDIKLFKIQNSEVIELESKSVAVEKSLQVIIERHLDNFLGVKFLATEYSTGKAHGGRIDTLGIDENGCPVIIEYKRAVNQNVISQGLFYLDWLLDHKGEFELLVLKKLGKEVSEKIEWSSPRLLCIAGDYTKYDQYAIQQINRNIELIRYRRYSDAFLLLDLVNAVSIDTEPLPDKSTSKKTTYSTVTKILAKADTELQDIFEALKELLLSFGDDVQTKTLKYYIAFKRIKNFACVEIHTQTKNLLVHVKVDPDTITLEKGFTRDMRNIGHFGTGALEITIRSIEDIEKAKPLLEKSYELS